MDERGLAASSRGVYAGAITLFFNARGPNWRSTVLLDLRCGPAGLRPLLAMLDKNQVDVLALGSSGDAPISVAPASNGMRPWDTSRMHYFNGMDTVAELDDDRVLIFSTNTYAGTDNEYPEDAQWTVGEIPSDAGEAAWASPTLTGHFAFPGNKGNNHSWIQVHHLTNDRLALTWTETNGTTVFDLHVAKLTVDEQGRPTLGSTQINVSQTFGETDNSDYPTILPSQGDMIWLSWRERNFGPRVSA